MLWVDRLPDGLPAQVQVARRIGKAEGALVVLWCNHPSVDQVFLYITRFRGGRILVRQVDRLRDGTLGRFEAIGAIVRTGVEAILRGGKIGIRPPPPPPPRPRRPAAKPVRVPKPTRRPAPPRLEVEVGYALAGFARAVPVLHGGQVGFSWVLHRNWALRLGYCFAPAIRVEGEPEEAPGVVLDLFQHALSLGVDFRWPLGRWTVGARALAVAHLQDYQPTTDGRLVAAEAGLDATFGVTLLAVAAWRLRPWLAFFGGLGFTTMIWNRHYTVRYLEQRRTILDPFPVQPRFVIGMRFRML
jgi:hypothetical protein